MDRVNINKREKILQALKDSDELATSKQLWVINDFCHTEGLNYSLPLSKYHACMIIDLVKQKDGLNITQKILEETIQGGEL
jgi:hypothetical protein